jgi:hypothetical protein
MGPSVSGGKRSNEPGHVLFRVEPRHLHVLRQNQKVNLSLYAVCFQKTAALRRRKKDKIFMTLETYLSCFFDN